MLMMILRRQRMRLHRRHFLTTSFAAVNARTRCGCAWLKDLVESLTVALGEKLRILIKNTHGPRYASLVFL
jgi:hypothetical protein